MRRRHGNRRPQVVRVSTLRSFFSGSDGSMSVMVTYSKLFVEYKLSSILLKDVGVNVLVDAGIYLSRRFVDSSRTGVDEA